MADTVDEIERILILALLVLVAILAIWGFAAFKGFKFPGVPDLGELLKQWLNSIWNAHWSTQDDGNNNEYATGYNPTIADQAYDTEERIEHSAGVLLDPTQLIPSDTIDNNETLGAAIQALPDSASSDPGMFLQNIGIL